MNNRLKGLVTCFISMVMLISGGCDNTNNPASTSEDKSDTMTEAVSTQSSLSDNMSERTTAATKNVTSETSGSDESETQTESYDMWSVLPYIDETPVEEIEYNISRPDPYFSSNLSFGNLEGGICVYGFKSKLDAVRIPDKIEGLPVLSVSLYSSPEYEGGDPYDATPKELIVPDTVQYIQLNPSRIEYMNIPESATVVFTPTYISEGTITQYSSLKGLYLCADFFHSSFVEDCDDIVIVKDGKKYMSDNIEEINTVCLPYLIRHKIENRFVYDRVKEESVKKEIETYKLVTCVNCIEEMNIPDYVTDIYFMAFMDCTNLKNVTIPEGINTIGSDAFSNCTGLQSLVLPDSAELIHYPHGGEYIFSGCTNLTSLTAGKILYSLSEDIEGFKTVTDLTITESYFSPDIDEYLKNMRLSERMPNLEYVSIIGDVSEIPSDFLADCEKLKEVTLPDSVVTIGNNAFSGCSSLRKINIGKSLTYLGDSAFSGCTSLESIDLPESVTVVGDEAFGNCSGLREINLGKTLNYLGDRAFSGCTSLESIDIPEGVTQFGAPFDQGGGNGWSVFYGCTSLKTVNLPDSLKGLGMWTFVDCDNLRYIRLPDNIEWIGTHFLGHDSNHGASVTFVYGSAMFITFSDRDENKYKNITVSYKGNDYTGYKKIEQLHETLLPEIPYEYSAEHYQEAMEGAY